MGYVLVPPLFIVSDLQTVLTFKEKNSHLKEHVCVKKYYMSKDKCVMWDINNEYNAFSQKYGRRWQYNTGEYKDVLILFQYIPFFWHIKSIYLAFNPFLVTVFT